MKRILCVLLMLIVMAVSNVFAQSPKKTEKEPWTLYSGTVIVPGETEKTRVYYEFRESEKDKGRLHVAVNDEVFALTISWRGGPVAPFWYYAPDAGWKCVFWQNGQTIRQEDEEALGRVRKYFPFIRDDVERQKKAKEKKDESR